MIKDDPASLSKDLKPVYDGSLEQQYYRVLGLNSERPINQISRLVAGETNCKIAIKTKQNPPRVPA